jgi:hypothetical protein
MSREKLFFRLQASGSVSKWLQLASRGEVIFC